MNGSSAKFRRLLRINLHLVFSYLRLHFKLFLLSLIAGLIFITILPQIGQTVFHKRPETVGLVGNFTVSTLPLSIQKEISFGLTRLNVDDQATSGAALSWQATNSGKTVIFNLDHNLFWQDGSKFDTSQINYNLKGVKIKKLNSYTLQFDLSEPFSPLPVIVSQPLFKKGLIGLGQEQVENLKFSGRFLSEVTLRNLDSGSLKTYKFYPTENQAVMALHLGSVDKIIGLHQVFDFASDPHFQIESQVEPDVIATLFFNLHQEFFAEKTFRQGLTYALPDTFPDGQSADTPMPLGSWALSNSVKKYPQNTAAAKADIGNISSSSAKTKVTISSAPDLQNTANQIALIWSNLGLSTDVTVTDSLPDSFDAYLNYLQLPVDPDQYALWHSTQEANISGYKSFKVDRLLEDGRKTFDLPDRKEIYSNFQRAITEDVPAIFLFYPKVYDISRKS